MSCAPEINYRGSGLSLRNWSLARIPLQKPIPSLNTKGFFVCANRRVRSLAEQLPSARRRIRDLIERLREDGLFDEEIRRAFDAELFHPAETVKKR